MRIYIVEDEPLITATIETALTKQGFKVVGDDESYEVAFEEIKQLKPDLVLLDIQLEGEKDGIDLALQLDQRNIPYLYLTSQTDPQTVLRVKETHPLGFIVKPFTETGLRSQIELAWHNFALTRDDFLIFKSEGQTYKVNQKEVKYLKAFDNYCYVITDHHEYLIPKTLKHTSETLNWAHFVKPHRSFVVNLRKVSSVGLDHLLVDGTTIPLTASNKELILQKLHS